jgi:hypothetical protein
MREQIELLARLAEERANLQAYADTQAGVNGQERLLALARISEIDWFVEVVKGVYL